MKVNAGVLIPNNRFRFVNYSEFFFNILWCAEGQKWDYGLNSHLWYHSVRSLHTDALRLRPISFVMCSTYAIHKPLPLFVKENQKEHTVLQPRRHQKPFSLFSSFTVCFCWQGVKSGPGCGTHDSVMNIHVLGNPFCTVCQGGCDVKHLCSVNITFLLRKYSVGEEVVTLTFARYRRSLSCCRYLYLSLPKQSRSARTHARQ